MLEEVLVLKFAGGSPTFIGGRRSLVVHPTGFGGWFLSGTDVLHVLRSLLLCTRVSGGFDPSMRLQG